MESDSSSDPLKPDRNPSTDASGFGSFWRELKRRKVMRVAAAYAVASWVVIEVSATVLPALYFPEWIIRMIVILAIVGFPVAVVLAWAFDLTKEGIKATQLEGENDEDAGAFSSQERKRYGLLLFLAAAVPTVVLGALAIFFYFRSSPDPSSLASGPTSRQVEDLDKSIAVLPLENLSPDPNNAFFADGVQEDVLTNLSKISELLVISRSSTLRYRTGDRNLKQIGKELGVRYLMEGSVRRAGDQVRVTAQLIDTETNGHLWAENYNRQLTDIFSIQSEIAKQIAAQLHAVISPEAQQLIEYRATESQEAYDAFMQTWDGIWSGSRPESEKIGLLKRAVELDPTFAEAWAQLAIESIYSWNARSARQDTAMYDQAHHALEQARSHGADLAYFPFAQASFASHEDKDTEASIRYLLEALDRDPGFSRPNAPLDHGMYKWAVWQKLS